jgi:hypothetical protein
MRYYDLTKNWRRVRPHVETPAVQAVLIRDFNRFTYGRWRKRFLPGMLPFEFESCDWFISRRGRPPAWHAYVKHAACHWLVNLWLETAQRTLPDRPWRILTSDRHSTVWDGEQLLFDGNFLALGVDPDECFSLANDEELPIGMQRKTHMASHWKRELHEKRNGHARQG